MAKYKIKELLGLLSEIIPNEIQAQSLHFLLRVEVHTANRLLSGGTLWPRMTTWHDNAYTMVKEEDSRYKIFCEKVLLGRQKDELSEKEKKQLRECEKDYEMDLVRRLEKAGIFQLQGCCYDPALPTPSDFNRLLLELVEAVLHLAKECRGISEKELVLDFLRRNDGTKKDLDSIMECSNCRAMAQFLVMHVDRRHEKDEDRLRFSGGPSGWMESSVCLHDRKWNAVGCWSFLPLNEEQLEQVRKGIRSEDSCADLLVAPGEYIFYRVRLSGLPNDKITSPLDMQRLVDAMWYKMLYYAKKGMYIRQLHFRISDMDTARMGLYRDLGFDFSAEDNGYCVQKLIPFPTSFRTAEPEIFSELKEMYDRRFLPAMSIY